MSVFRVKVNNIAQGLLDLDPSTHPLAAGSGNSPASYGDLGEPFGRDFPSSGAVSLQRQMWVAGPNGTYRLLKDGETFTDNNYWKRFAYPQIEREFAFIEVLTDDGSVYSDIPEENTFGVGGAYTLSPSYDATNTIDFVGTHGGPATFLQVQNLEDATGETITGELNGDVNLTFQLSGGESQIFNNGDLAITQIRLKNTDATGTPVALVLAAVRSVSNS